MSSHAIMSESVIARMLEYAQTQPNVLDQASFLAFIPLYLRNISYEDMLAYEQRDLYGALLNQWNLLERYKPGAVMLRVYNPTLDDDGWYSTHTVVQLVIEDMPFLIDSMRMELNRLGITTHQMIFLGGMQVIRDAGGRITELHPPTDLCSNCDILAPIHMEIDRQSDEGSLQQLYHDLMRVIKDRKSVV